ncbi:MAG: hypothetical protein ACC645_22620, partial [Pirellulales bacterium]
MFISLIVSLNLPGLANAFSYILAGDDNGVGVVTHPFGYDGTGGVLGITVGIDPAFPLAAEMESAARNVIDTWNSLVPTTGNVQFGGASDVPSGQFDFESTLLHEVGHALGLSHPNLGGDFGFTGADTEYTRSTVGANGTFDLDPGGDGIIGSADDVRGDDQTLNWFRKSNNNPFSVGSVVDANTYSRDIAVLPTGDLYSVNPDRTVADLVFALPNTESVMQQGQANGEAKRTLGHDDVAGIRYAISGLDETAGTGDDYTYVLEYIGMTSAADIVVDMSLSSGFAGTGIGASGLGAEHWAVNSARVSF